MIQPTHYAFPAKGEAAGRIVLAVLEQIVEGVLPFPIVVLDVQELFPKGRQIRAGEFSRVGDHCFPPINRPGLLGGKMFEGQFVFGEGPRMVADQDLGREAVLAFANHFVPVVESRAGAL